MLDRDDELKLLGFLAGLAGLLGIVVSVSQFEVGSASSATVRAYFSVILVVFMFASTCLSRRTGGQGRQTVESGCPRIFLRTVRLGVGLAAANLFPVAYQFAGFWITGLLVSFLFYWSLQRWHRNLKWSSGQH